MFSLKTTFFGAMLASTAIAAPVAEAEAVAVAEPVAQPVVVDAVTFSKRDNVSIGGEILGSITRDIGQIIGDFEKALHGQLDIGDVVSQVVGDVEQDISKAVTTFSHLLENIDWLNIADDIAGLFGQQYVDLVNALAKVEQDGVQLVGKVAHGQLPTFKSLLSDIHDLSDLALDFGIPASQFIPGVGPALSTALHVLRSADDALWNLLQKL